VPFQIVEGISMHTGGGPKSLNESAAALSGITSQPWAGGSQVSSSTAAVAGGITLSGDGSGYLMNDRRALVTALRRGLSESRGIADVLTEFQDGL
jgi:hypothetical protein